MEVPIAADQRTKWICATFVSDKWLRPHALFIPVDDGGCVALLREADDIGQAFPPIELALQHSYATSSKPLVMEAFSHATLSSAVISCHRVSVCPSVCHKSVFY